MKTTIIFLLLSLVSIVDLHAQEKPQHSDFDSIIFLGDTELSVKLYFELSKTYTETQNYDSAFYYLSGAELLANKLNDLKILADVKYKKGQLLDIQSKYGDSERLYIEALNLYASISDTNNIAKSYNKLGVSYRHLGKYSQALGAFNKGLKFYMYTGNFLGQASVKVNIGNVFKNVEKFDKAKNAYREAITMFKSCGDENLLANCYNNLGNVFKNESQFDSAYFYMHKTLEIRTRTKNTRGLSYIYHNLANLHLINGNIDSALIYIDESYILKVEAGDLYGQAGDLEIYAEIFMKQGRWEKAIRYLETSLFLLKDYQDLEYEKDLFRLTAVCYSKTANYRKSTEWFLKYLDAEEKLNKLSSKKLLEEELIEYEFISDSIQKEHLILQKDLQESKNENDQLSNKVLRKNIFLLIIGMLLVLLIVITTLLKYRQRLKASREKHQVLAKSSVPKEEKEILLKEVHHRVKNNFQIINSLIRIQSEFMNAGNYKMKLKDLETRIRSMALIHEKLYKNDRISKLNVSEYLTELADYILESYAATSTKLHFNIKVENVEYGIDALIPLGLILNETISNSIKHAFKDDVEGEITIHLSNTEESTFLLIADNGVGSDISTDQLKEKSLGLELIFDLTDQLDGALKLQKENGFTYKFNFPRLK